MRDNILSVISSPCGGQIITSQEATQAMISRKVGSNKFTVTSGLKEISIRVGELQRRVLEYAFKCSTFSVCEVVVYYHPSASGRERVRLLKRYHDAVVRLYNRGFVERVSRGVYRLVRFAPFKVVRTQHSFLSGGMRLKEKVCEVERGVGRGWEYGAGVCVSSGGEGVVVRHHVVFGSRYSLGDYVVAYFERLYAGKCFLEWLCSAYERFIIRRGFVSRRGVRRVKGRVRRVLLSVLSSAVVRVGVHGVRFGRVGRVRRLFVGVDELHRLSVFRYSFCEFGVDVVGRGVYDVLRGLMGFQKIYVARPSEGGGSFVSCADITSFG